MIKKCRSCYFYKNVNIGGKMYAWCFNQDYNGLISDVSKAKECTYVSPIDLFFDIIVDKLSRNQNQQRNNKIKSKCQTFRFHYSIENGIADIISRYSHWILVLSDNKEHLYHQNMNIFNSTDYSSMYLTNKPDFHLHKIFENSPMTVYQAFKEIEKHDTYVLENRYYRNIKRSKI